jgi:transposase-like protein
MLSSVEFKTIIDVVTRFPNEKSCHQYLASRKWADGVVSCPFDGCESETVYVFTDGIRYKCKCCRKIFTAKTGTFMEASKLPTLKWFIALYMILHKKGISSMQLAKDIGVTQKTAWFLLHRIRTALGNETVEQLSGEVEIDETFVGGKNRFRHKDKKLKYNPGRGWKDKTPVFGAIQRGGRLVAMVIPDVTALTIRNKVVELVEKGSSIMSDGFNGYRALEKDYTVEVCDHGRGQWRVGDCYTNTLEGAWSQLKRSIIGIYIQVTPRHLNKYVQEFTFRYNYRHLGAQGQIDTIIANMNCRLKYKQLIRS